jgi:hypothetical protein
MSVLSEYVAELWRQEGLLGRAELYDELTLASHPDAMHWHRADNKRHWTRQDSNRVEYECALQEIEMQNLPLWEDMQTRAAVPRPRMRTRLEFVLRKHWRSIDPLHKAALADVKSSGIYATLAPLLVECLESHRRLFAAYRGDDDYGGESLERGSVKQRWKNAVEALEAHLPAEPVLTPDEERQKFCFEQWQANKSLGEINAMLKRHPYWEHFDDEKQVRGPRDAWGKRIGVKPRKGQPGRRKKSARQ